MSNDMESGENYFDFKKHYQINLNASKTKRQKHPFNENYFMNKYQEVFSNKVKIVEIDLVYFKNLCYTNGDIKSLSEFEKLMGLLGCQNKEEQKFFESEKGMIEVIMKKADKFRDDSKMIEMYDRDVMFEHMRKKELSDAIYNTTEEVTNNITNKIAINMIKENADIEFISKTTGLSIEEINKLKEELN